MSQASMSELLQRMRMLETQLQTMQQQVQQMQGQPDAQPARYGDLRMAGAITPAGPEIASKEAAEAQQIAADRQAAVSSADNLPDFDPEAWGERKPGQSDAGRRQEIIQIQKRRQAVRQSQLDKELLNDADTELDLPPAVNPLEAATAFANERAQRMAREHAQPPNVRPEPPQRAPGASEQGNQPRPTPPLPPPYTPKQDTNTQIPQPPDWKDSPERLTRGPVGQQPQQQTFYQAQTSFDTAVARQMQMLAGFIENATQRIEELECWREAMGQG